MNLHHWEQSYFPIKNITNKMNKNDKTSAKLKQVTKQLPTDKVA